MYLIIVILELCLVRVNDEKNLYFKRFILNSKFI